MSLKVCSRLVPVVSNSVSALSVPRYSFCRLLSANRLVTPSVGLVHISSCKYSTKPSTAPTKPHIKEVYYGVLTPQIKAVKIFSLTSSIVGLIAQPFLYSEIASTGNIPIILAAYSFIGFFTVLTPILLHLVTKKYITHLIYKEDTNSYVATTVNFFCLSKEIEFKSDDVKVPSVPGMFTSFTANGKSLFLDPRLFEHPEHYAKIMGYDKPLDFKLYEDSESNVKKN
ncbi:unnamed protein product [Phaedon cochleariae]|uniref:Transmembrane protein 70 n=1 Tax=Phaedon cochleariae TaxID=80249 RepID=A0A9N9X1D6_PHACE|nr:unnamed protein product [Phaedon cochleariae]